jgi:hypothetical protein
LARDIFLGGRGLPKVVLAGESERPLFGRDFLLGRGLGRALNGEEAIKLINEDVLGGWSVALALIVVDGESMAIDLWNSCASLS